METVHILGLYLITERGHSQEKSKSKDDPPNFVLWYNFSAVFSRTTQEEEYALGPVIPLTCLASTCHTSPTHLPVADKTGQLVSGNSIGN